MPALSVTRHLPVFDPERFGSTLVDVIGCGATGSRVAYGLAKLGIKKLRLWDFDKVEAHNIANQLFGLKDIGEYKADALAARIKQDTGLRVETMRQRATGAAKLGPVVFLLTDTMASRREIWDGAIRLNPRARVMIETRMGVDLGRVYTVDPQSLEQIQDWEATLRTDDKVAVSACGTAITVGPTSDVLAGVALWQFIRWYARTLDTNAIAPEHELIFSLRPAQLVVHEFTGA